MKITKIGHCCLLIEMSEITILTDPGAFSDGQNKITGIDVVLITHEHGDHLHTESLQEIINNNPDVQIYTNTSTGKILDENNIIYTILDGQDTLNIKGILFESFDAKHAEIFKEFGQVQNTGYFIDNKLFYPGDAYCNPKKPVEILALPVAGPWAKVPDVIRYALDVKPKKAFPVHDAILNKEGVSLHHRIVGANLKEHNIEFIPLKEGDSQEF